LARQRYRPVGALLASALALGSCQSYAPAPLAEGPDLVTEAPRLSLPVQQLHIPGVASTYTFDPSRGLDMTGVAILAVSNNPQLRAERAKAGVARAQLFAAGLLPDPQLALTFAHPIAGPAAVNAFSAGLNYLLDQVITRPAAKSAARAEVRAVDLDALWQEWQVAQQARIFYAQVRSLEKQAALLERYRALYADAYDRSARALTHGDLTLDVTGTNLVALLDAEFRLDKMQQDLDRARHQLAATLGLAPGTDLPLADGGEPPAPDDNEVRAAMAALVDRRADLLALKAGYESQEARLRQAVLAQFPSLAVGVTEARDNTGIYSIGPSITLGLPFFNGNRGNIAIEQATRARLGAEYQARIDATVGEVDQLRILHAELTQQLARLQQRLPLLESMAEKARRAYAARDLAAASYLQLEQTLLNQQIGAITVEESLIETRIGLQTLLGMPIGSASGAAP
jgi:outer membrane protein, heavy metal efflux system